MIISQSNLGIVSGSRACARCKADSAGPRVLFAAGGTGGHVYPAIAIAEEVRRMHPEAEIQFVGTRDRMEWVVVPQAGYAITAIPAVALRRPLWSLSNFLLPARLLHSTVLAWRLIHGFRPHLVVGTGGYVAGPVCLVAALTGCPMAIQEQNAYAGITNRILARFAKLVFLAFAAASSFFPKEKCRLRGNPTRSSLQNKIYKAEAAAFFLSRVQAQDGASFGKGRGDGGGKPGESEKVVLVMGGSLGARAINMAVAGMAKSLLTANPGLQIIWQTGSQHFNQMLNSVGHHPRLHVFPYLDRMDLAYAAADIVVARAGAITCSELLVTAKPSILIPSPNVAEDHQTKNAKAMVEAGAAKLLSEKDLDPASLSSLIIHTLEDEAELENMRKSALKAATPDAAASIAKEVLTLVYNKTGGDLPSN